jgi:PKD repeat protein
MKKAYTRQIFSPAVSRLLPLLISLFCSSYTGAASACNITAQWSDSIPAGDSVVFTAIDTNAAAHHIWRLGDGTVDSSTIHFSHVYAAAGVYTVCFYTYIPGTGCIDSLCQAITVGDTCHITAAWASTALGSDSVRFTASDTNSRATHIWNFGDGNIAYGTTAVTHHYAASGTYQVCFYAYIAGTACSDSLCASITVSDDTCGLSALWTYAASGDTVRFLATDTGLNLHYTYDFGDGTSASGSPDTVHVYATDGFYTACLHINYPGTNCMDSICQSISVGSNPCHITPAWTYYTHGGDSAVFTVSDTNSQATHVWNFGDGTYASGVTNTSHHYAAPGTYQVCFYVQIPGTACSQSQCANVTVTSDTCGLTAAWNAYPLGGDSIRFAALDTNSLAHHIFSFGDGTSSADTTQAIHIYAAAGTYQVCLYVYIPGTGCSDSLCSDIVAGTPPCNVTAGWTSYNLGGDSIYFSAADTNSSATHLWNFGDGTYAYGTTAVTHSFAGTGTYHVCFFAYSATCTDSFCSNVAISADTCHITPVWSYYSLGVDSVRFIAADTNSLAHHIFSFGDGTYASGSTDTTHHYDTAGTYQVCFYSYIPGTGCSDSLCKTVVVADSITCTITAAWSSTLLTNDSVRFTASDTNSAAHHYWSFGDGANISGTTNIAHHYATAGSYLVCFYTYIPGTNCSDSLCRMVTVTDSSACAVTAAWVPTLLTNDSVLFIASDNTANAHHIFNFGDGTTASGSTDTVHQYAAAGTYHVCFYAYIPGTACSDSLCRDVTVTDSVICHITAAWTSTNIGGDSVSFSASDTNSLAHHSWSFGDGATVSGTTQTIHAYAAPGSYAVCFYTYIPGADCSDSLCQAINVALGINDIAAAMPNITVMPNPFGQYTMIKVDGAIEPYELNIYDMVGKAVRHETSVANTFGIERGALAPGMYTYEVLLKSTAVGKGKIVAE